MSSDQSPEALPPLNTVISECDSTQSLGRAWAERGAAHGSWVSARRQARGRGRHERTWVSPEGNLFLSVIVRGIPPSLWTWIPLAGAVAARRASLDLLPETWESRISIKWPNDLLVDGAKAGGILCESSLAGSDERSFVIVGMGLNCLEAPPLADRSTARLPVSLDALRSGVILSLLAVLEELVGPDGVGRIAREYSSGTFFKVGAVCRWKDDTGRECEGEVRGLGPHGELKVCVRGASGIEELLLTSEEVTLGAVRSGGT